MRIYLGGGYVYGVPARDLTEDEWHGLTPEQQEAAASLYKTPRKSRAHDESDPKIVLAGETGLTADQPTNPDTTQEF